MRPWSTIDDEELALLRQLHSDVKWGAGDDPVVSRTLKKLEELQKKLRTGGPR